MNEFYLIIGILLIVIGIIDFLWTTLWIEGGSGPVTNRLSIFLWKVLRKLSGDHPKVLSLAGPLLLSLALLTWISFFLAGWTLVFASDPGALTDTQEKAPASWVERAYFSGYVFFTLGNGEIVPNGGAWEIATILATATGMLSITFAVTYLLSVLNAVSAKRAFAQSVTGMGKSGAEIVASSWNGKDFHAIDLMLASCSSELSMLTAQHTAYPVLHYYHSESANRSGVTAVAILEDALTIFCFGVPEKHQPNRLLLKEARSSVESYLETIQTARMKPASVPPPAPSLEHLRKKGLPVESDRAFEAAVGHLEERRKKTAGILEASAAEWPSGKHFASL